MTFAICHRQCVFLAVPCIVSSVQTTFIQNVSIAPPRTAPNVTTPELTPVITLPPTPKNMPRFPVVVCTIDDGARKSDVISHLNTHSVLNETFDFREDQSRDCSRAQPETVVVFLQYVQARGSDIAVQSIQQLRNRTKGRAWRERKDKKESTLKAALCVHVLSILNRLRVSKRR